MMTLDIARAELEQSCMRTSAALFRLATQTYAQKLCNLAQGGARIPTASWDVNETIGRSK